MKTNLCSLKKLAGNFTGLRTPFLKRAAFALLFLLAAVVANAKYKAVGFIVNSLTVSNVQTGSLSYGTGGSVTYTITLDESPGGTGAGLTTTFSLNWLAGTPAGISFTPNTAVTLTGGTQTVTLTVNSADATPAVNNNSFTVTCSQNSVTSSGSASFVVDKIALTVTANDLGKTYGSALTLSHTAFTTSGLVNSDAVNFIGVNSSGAAATAKVSGSPYTINLGAATGTGLSNYTISYVTGLLSVFPKRITISGSAQNKTYGTDLGLGTTAFTTNGLINGDVVSGVTLTSDGAAATAPVSGSPYSIILGAVTGTGIDNYTIQSRFPGELTVNAAPLTITANDSSKAYGQTFTTGAGSTGFTPTGLQNGETIGSVTVASAGADAGAGAGAYPITATAATGGTFDADNYDITYVGGNLAVTNIPINASASAGVIQCNAGTTTLTVSASGGDGTLQYSLDGTTYQAGNTFTLGKGNYTVTVKDADNFTTNANLAISEPDVLGAAVLSAANTQVCFGRSINIKASVAGGTAPYYYSLNGGTYQTVRTFPVLPGDYSVAITDTFGCATLTTNTLTITQPATKLIVSAAQLSNANITVTASGSFSGYMYSLNGGAYQPSNIFTSFPPGTNTVTVKDNAGCVASTHTNTLSATLAIVGDNKVCYGGKGKIQATIAGGSKPFTYSLDGTTYQTGRTFSVPAGDYKVTIMDAAGYAFITNSVTIIQPAAKLSISTVTTPVSCSTATDGSITLSGANGFGGYTYNIDGGSYNGNTVFSNLAAGVHAVSALDANGCVAKKSITLKVPTTVCSSLLGSSNISSASTTGMVGVLTVTALPNPSNVEFNLQMAGGDSKKVVEIKVMDMQGRTVYQTRGSVLDVFRFGRTFTSGIYIAEIINGNNVQRVKLVKGN